MTDRTPRSPRDRALEALGVATRRFTKAAKAVDTARVAFTDAGAARREAAERLEYAAKDPALNAEDRAEVDALLGKAQSDPEGPAEREGQHVGVGGVGVNLGE